MDWQRLHADWAAWWHHDLNRPMVMIEYIDPTGLEREDESYRKLRCSIPEDIRYASNFPLDMPAAQVVEIYRERMRHFRWLGDAWPRWYPNFGPGSVAGYLGGSVESRKETVWFGPLPTMTATNGDTDFDGDNVWWRRTLELTRAAAASLPPEVCVGFTDLGGTLDILASLRGTSELLFDLVDHPEVVERRVRSINGHWLRYYQALAVILKRTGMGTTPWAHLLAEGGCYMLQCDFAYMISPEHFERFVLPDLEACCDAIEYPFYHLDGRGQIVHLEMLLSIGKLRGIQWIPGAGSPEPEQWLPLLSRIRQAGKLCQLYVTASGAMTIAKELGGKGFAFAITDITDERQAGEFLEAISAMDQH
jgi:5-methyltetrahydrofolate--homocysteine methyltransferase